MGMGVNDHVPQKEMIDEKDRASFVKAMKYMDIKPGAAINGQKIDYVFIGSCTNSRIEDLRLVAEFVKRKQKNDDVEVWIVPGSKKKEEQAIAEGNDKKF